MTNKQNANRELKALEILGCMVFNMSSNKYMPTGMKGFPDHLIVCKNGCMFFIEDKFGSDKLSSVQVNVREVIDKCATNNPMIFYYINTGTIQHIITDIVNRIA